MASWVECNAFVAPAQRGEKVWIVPIREKTNWTINGPLFSLKMGEKLRVNYLSNPSPVDSLIMKKQVRGGYDGYKNVWVDEDTMTVSLNPPKKQAGSCVIHASKGEFSF